jgi:hypothetical protein
MQIASDSGPDKYFKVFYHENPYHVQVLYIYSIFCPKFFSMTKMFNQKSIFQQFFFRRKIFILNFGLISEKINCFSFLYISYIGPI